MTKTLLTDTATVLAWIERMSFIETFTNYYKNAIGQEAVFWGSAEACVNNSNLVTTVSEQLPNIREKDFVLFDMYIDQLKWSISEMDEAIELASGVIASSLPIFFNVVSGNDKAHIDAFRDGVIRLRSYQLCLLRSRNPLKDHVHLRTMKWDTEGGALMETSYSDAYNSFYRRLGAAKS